MSPGTSPACQGWRTPRWVGEEGTVLALAAGRLARLHPTPQSTGGTFWGVPRGRHTVGAWQRFVKYPRHGRYHSLGDGGCWHQRGALLIVHVQAAFLGAPRCSAWLLLLPKTPGFVLDPPSGSAALPSVRAASLGSAGAVTEAGPAINRRWDFQTCLLTC